MLDIKCPAKLNLQQKDCFELGEPCTISCLRFDKSDMIYQAGIYTLKLFKEGAWRYLHVDDRLPCSPSRAPHFCSSKEPNQASPRSNTRSYSTAAAAAVVDHVFVVADGGGDDLFVLFFLAYVMANNTPVRDHQPASRPATPAQPQ